MTYREKHRKKKYAFTDIFTFWDSDVCEITVFGGLSKKLEAIEKYLSDDVKKKVLLRLPTRPAIYGAVKRFVER